MELLQFTGLFAQCTLRVAVRRYYKRPIAPVAYVTDKVVSVSRRGEVLDALRPPAVHELV
jgi:hypothetical protein